MTKSSWQFVGTWIGETQGYDESPAHIWEITQHGYTLEISTRWENENELCHLRADLSEDDVSFEISGYKKSFRAHILDSQHFIIKGWDTNDIRGHTGPDYDVVFSRPGIAELTAHSVWKKSVNKLEF
jgi:hypothetical protein